MLKRFITSLVCLAFITNYCQPVYAQPVGGDFSINQLPMPGKMISTTPAFVPLTLKGMVIHPENALKFDFLMDTGHSHLNGDGLSAEALKIMKYFLTALTIPEDDLWVNLSPYEKGRIIQDNFGQTIMGRDLLAQDYILKQLTSSLIYPEKALGKEFWQQVYSKAAKEYGTTQIPVNTFNKVWIVPAEAVVWEHEGKVLIVKSHLKVMLEEDYLSMSKHADVGVTEGGASPASAGFGEQRRVSGMRTEHAGETRGQDPNINKLGSEIVRNLVLPVLEKEVNEGKNFIQLRQMFQAMILATWYKKALKESILNKVYADKKKVAGIGYTSSPPLVGGVREGGINDVEAIYQRYLKAFKKGAFNYIKEDVDPTTGQTIPRKYFSGGFSTRDEKSNLATKLEDWKGPVETLPASQAMVVEAAAIPVDQTVLVAGALGEFGAANPTPGALTGNSAMIVAPSIAYGVAAGVISLIGGGIVSALIAAVQKKMNPDMMVNSNLERLKNPISSYRESAVDFLGNNGNPGFADLLLELALKDTDSAVQIHTILALVHLKGAISSEKTRNGIAQIALHGTNPAVQTAAWVTLEQLWPEFTKTFKRPEGVSQDAAMFSWTTQGRIEDAEQNFNVDEFLSLLGEKKEKFRQDTMAAIDRVPDIENPRKKFSIYEGVLRNPNYDDVCVWAVGRLGKLGELGESEELMKVKKEAGDLLFNSLLILLQRLKDKKSAGSTSFQVAIPEALGKLKYEAAIQLLERMAGIQPSYPRGTFWYNEKVIPPGVHLDLRKAAARALVECGDKGGVFREKLKFLLGYSDDNNAVHDAAEKKLAELEAKTVRKPAATKTGKIEEAPQEAGQSDLIEGYQRALKAGGQIGLAAEDKLAQLIGRDGVVSFCIEELEPDKNIGDYKTRRNLVEALGRSGNKQAVEPLRKAFDRGIKATQGLITTAQMGNAYFYKQEYLMEIRFVLHQLGVDIEVPPGQAASAEPVPASEPVPAGALQLALVPVEPRQVALVLWKPRPVALVPVKPPTADASQLGGIALNAKMLDLQIKRDGAGAPLPISQQPLDKINIQGFVPQIISIQPVDLAALFGLSGQSGALTGP